MRGRKYSRSTDDTGTAMAAGISHNIQKIIHTHKGSCTGCHYSNNFHKETP
jgi:hypothetical protein